MTSTLSKIARTDFVGNMIRTLFQGRLTFHNSTLDVRSKKIRGRLIPLILFEKYEKEEIRLLKDHLQMDLDVIELGSSIGGVSTVLGSLTSAKVYCYEANPDLIDILSHNLRINGLLDHTSVHYAAVSTSNTSEVFFNPRESSELGKLSDDANEGTAVPATSVKKIVDEKGLKSFALVADIEGSEAAFILGEPESLEGCKQLFIELHNCSWEGKEYTAEDLKNEICELGFTCIESIGTNHVFIK